MQSNDLLLAVDQALTPLTSQKKSQDILSYTKWKWNSNNNILTLLSLLGLQIKNSLLNP